MRVVFALPNVTLRCGRCLASSAGGLDPLTRQMVADIRCECETPALELIIDASPAGPLPLAILPLVPKVSGEVSSG